MNIIDSSAHHISFQFLLDIFKYFSDTFLTCQIRINDMFCTQLKYEKKLKS